MRWPWEKTDKGRYIPNYLSIFPCALFIVIARAILIGYHNMHSLKGVVGFTVLIYRVSWGNVQDFGRMFLKLKYTNITQNTYIRS